MVANPYTDETTELSLKDSSLSIGEKLTISVPRELISLPKISSYTLHIFKVSTLFTEVAFSTNSSAFKETESRIEIEVPTDNLAKGLYLLGDMVFSPNQDDNVGSVTLSNNQAGKPLFEITNSLSGQRAPQELQAEYDDCLKERKMEISSGFRDDEHPGENPFSVVVFITDCLITKHLPLAKYEIFKCRDVSTRDELLMMLETLQGWGFIQNKNCIKEYSDDFLFHHPSAFIHFPLIYSNTHVDAGAIAEKEGNCLIDLLSLSRDSYGKIIGVFVFDLIKRELTQYRVIPTPYFGNLLGGDIAGERSSDIYKKMDRIRGNKKLKFHFVVYNDAQKTRDINLAYLKYWSILEIIAEESGIKSGMPRYLWDGSKETGRVIGGALDRVFEMCRLTFNKDNANPDFLFDRNMGLTIREQLEIAYRRRNCAAHNGGCLPDRVRDCLEKNEKCGYKACRKEHENTLQVHSIRTFGTDRIFDHLKLIAGMVLMREVNVEE